MVYIQSLFSDKKTDLYKTVTCLVYIYLKIVSSLHMCLFLGSLPRYKAYLTYSNISSSTLRGECENVLSASLLNNT